MHAMRIAKVTSTFVEQPVAVGREVTIVVVAMEFTPDDKGDGDGETDVLGGGVVGIAVDAVGVMMVAAVMVTAAFLAKARPFTTDDAPIVIAVCARMVPSNEVFAESVAELPICQKTLCACVPLTSKTKAPKAVLSVVAAWKMNTAFGRFWPSRVMFPVICRSPAAVLITPGTTVVPPSSVPTTVDEVRPTQSLYAVRRSPWACSAVESAACITP